MPKKVALMGRIALRVEGDNWNAYWALPKTMMGALFLGSIPMAFVQRRDRKEAFMALMRDCIGDLIEEQHGARPEWPGAQPAPEHERTKQ